MKRRKDQTYSQEMFVSQWQCSWPKKKKKTDKKYLRDILNDVQVLRSEGIPEIGWLPFGIPEQQYMKSFQLCLGQGGGGGKGTNYVCHL
jgi:hypothetical protein